MLFPYPAETMFSCQPLHTYLRHSCNGYAAARRAVFALTCGLLLLYGAEEAVQVPSSGTSSVQSTAPLWMSADNVQTLVGAAPAHPAPVSRHASDGSTAAVEAPPAEANRCLPGPLMPQWTLNCVMIDAER